MTPELLLDELEELELPLDEELEVLLDEELELPLDEEPPEELDVLELDADDELLERGPPEVALLDMAAPELEVVVELDEVEVLAEAAAEVDDAVEPVLELDPLPEFAAAELEAAIDEVEAVTELPEPDAEPALPADAEPIDVPVEPAEALAWPEDEAAVLAEVEAVAGPALAPLEAPAVDPGAAVQRWLSASQT